MARVAVIDDDKALSEVLAEVLGLAGHKVSLSATGTEGIARIKHEHPDLVVCDVDMPSLDGYGVLAAVRADAGLRSIPFLFLTGQRGEREVRRGMNLGADDYLTKPVEAAELLAAVETRLARSAASKHDLNQRLADMRRSVAVLLPHELRTPLTVILGAAELLRAARSEMTGDQIDEMLDAVVSAGHRLQAMAENYVMYAGLELQRLAGEPMLAVKGATGGAADVEAAARAAALQAGRDADQRYELEEVAIPLAPPYVRKIVTELMGNALKFSEPGRVVRVKLGRDPGPCLAVTDDGRGMTAAQIADVSAFRQFDRALFEQQGSGLGLALVRGIAAASGGTLELTSAPGSGTQVRLRWPE